jgi:flagellar assembly factor FliW
LDVETTRFGMLRVEDERIIDMPQGMLGFPDRRRFLILQHKENSPFYWYQSVEDPALAFVIVNPFLFKPDYDVDISGTVKEMSWNGNGGESPFQLFVVVNIPEGAPQEMTANLMGPILINNTNNQAVQMVLSEGPYTHRHPILEEKTL